MPVPSPDAVLKGVQCTVAFLQVRTMKSTRYPQVVQTVPLVQGKKKKKKKKVKRARQEGEGREGKKKERKVKAPSNPHSVGKSHTQMSGDPQHANQKEDDSLSGYKIPVLFHMSPLTNIFSIIPVHLELCTLQNWLERGINYT